MQFLVIGYPLPNKDIDNYNALTAPSYFDYDGLLVDPASITAVAQSLLQGEREFEAFDGRQVLNAPTTASSVSAADQFRRRHDETTRILEAGGVVLVLARPNAVQGGIAGFEGCDRYSWLPAPAGMAWAPPYLVAAEGKTIRVVAEDHPVAGPLRTFRSGAKYRAVFDDRHAPVRQGRVLATGGAGLPIAMEFKVLAGRVVFLPVLTEETGNVRSEVADAVVDLFLELSTAAVGQEAPYWARSQAVPGLEQVEAELEELETAAREATERLGTARTRHDTLASYRDLLWAEGRKFQASVEQSLRTLGFTVTDEGGRLQVESEGRVALVEVESARELVVEWPYVRLQRRQEEALFSGGEPKGGLIVVTGHRAQEPSQREPEFSDPLRIACENYRFGLLTGQTLFALVQRALGGADEAALTGIRRRLLATHGLLSTEAALGDVTEGTDAGPIF
ncbi:MAG TPA: hypothetical protein VFY90_08180 [Tepidiformaceae bacterium]|nr:hypothetical protein [Tepidiformaceae bacterium]